MAGKTYRWTPERRLEVENILRTCSTRQEAAGALGIGLGALDHACGVYGIDARDLLGRGEEIKIEAPPPSNLSGQELIDEMKKRYARLAASEQVKNLVPVKIPGDQPIGIFIPGDLHLDDPGTNVGLVEDHARLVRNTPGMWGLAPGDFLNLWIGRLNQLYAHQNVTRAEGWKVVEWYFELVRDWLAVTLGNHDVWAGTGKDNPLNWIAQNHGIYSQEHDVRLDLQFGNGRSFRAHCRHDFPGHSMWNETHSLARAAIMGSRDDLKIAGHRHTSGYQIIADPETGRAMHMVRVTGYKVIDDYPVQKGFLRHNLGPAAVVVLEPRVGDTHPDRCKVFWDPHEGADFLKFKRSRPVQAAA